MKKNYDAVRLMREARAALQMRYASKPELENADLRRIRCKYRIPLGPRRKSA
mgnify:CR=1 FL=1